MTELNLQAQAAASLLRPMSGLQALGEEMGRRLGAYLAAAKA